MALQDLTPQLRTRLGRIERIVGLFVSLATLLLLAGFAYYVYHTAQRKGWLVTKVPYYTMIDSATGLKLGDPVKLMGFDAGEITLIEPMPPGDVYRVYVAFQVKWPFYGYIWTDSEVKVGSADFLGNRFLEATKGGTSGKTNVHATYNESKNGLEMWIDPFSEPGDEGKRFESVKMLKAKARAQKQQFKGYLLIGNESPPLSDQLSHLVSQVEHALPNVLDLTNRISAVLTNTSRLITNLDQTVTSTQPILSNVNLITANLREPNGSLGQWLIPTNTQAQLDSTLASAHMTLGNADTNLAILTSNLNQTILNLSGITSNLNAQVQANSFVLSEISSLVSDADDFVQGLKRNWLLRSSFKSETNPAPQGLIQPRVGGER